MQTVSELPSASGLLTTGFSALAVVLVVVFVVAVYASWRGTGEDARASRRAATIGAMAAMAWLILTSALAEQGALRFWAPPSMLLLLLVTFALALGAGVSRIGGRLALGIPLALLVGFQGFRIIVELLLHRAYSEGLMPVQMSYSGRNFDIISGITALGVAGWLATGRRSLALVATWNALGVGLLLNILIVALLSAPTPARIFMNEPANVWITQAPWVWLPTVMVFVAVLGHVVVTRRLIYEWRSASRTSAPPQTALSRAR